MEFTNCLLLGPCRVNSNAVRICPRSDCAEHGPDREFGRNAKNVPECIRSDQVVEQGEPDIVARATKIGNEGTAGEDTSWTEFLGFEGLELEESKGQQEGGDVDKPTEMESDIQLTHHEPIEIPTQIPIPTPIVWGSDNEEDDFKPSCWDRDIPEEKCEYSNWDNVTNWEDNEDPSIKLEEEKEKQIYFVVIITYKDGKQTYLKFPDYDQAYEAGEKFLSDPNNNVKPLGMDLCKVDDPQWIKKAKKACKKGNYDLWLYKQPEILVTFLQKIS